jgi:hypothetical protein
MDAGGRLRFAELSSSLGAGVLGAGIGVLAHRYLSGLGLAILLVGLAMHAWGMFDQHRIETKEGVSRVWWSTLLYWICWACLAAVVIVGLLRAARA